MLEKSLYKNLNNKGLISVLPPTTDKIFGTETERSLFELAHTSTARRESLMSGLSDADGSTDQLGQPVGRFTSAIEIKSATDELDLIEKTWREFYTDALEAGDTTAANFVVETVLQHFGFDPQAEQSSNLSESKVDDKEWLDQFSQHCLSTEVKVLQYIYWPILLSDNGTLNTDKKTTYQPYVVTGISLSADDLERCFGNARIAGKLKDDDLKKISTRRGTLEDSDHRDVGPVYVCLGRGRGNNFRLSFVGAFSKEINNRVRTLSCNSVLTFEIDSAEAADLVLKQLDSTARVDEAGTSQNRNVIFQLIDKFYPEEASKSMKKYFTDKFEIIDIRDNRNLDPPPTKVAPPKI